MFTKRLLSAFSLPLTLLVSPAYTQAPTSGYVFTYHEGPWPGGGAPPGGVFLSYSLDGLDFVPLNGGQPVFVTPEFTEDDNDNVGSNTVGPSVTRDPSIVYDPDGGLYHMVWTSNLNSRSIGYASSPDLVNWSEPELLQLWDHLPASTPVGRSWAPEWFYDDVADEYAVIFSSDVDGESIREYYTKTSDFASFSQPELLYATDDGGSVIDSVIAKLDDGQYVLATVQDGGIRMFEGGAPYGPWTAQPAPAVGPGSQSVSNSAEGPTLIEIDGRWLMYFDKHSTPGEKFGVVAADGAAGVLANEWTDLTDEANLPGYDHIAPEFEGPPRHGTVFEAPNATLPYELFPFDDADLDGDGSFAAGDWLVFSDYHLTELDGLSVGEQAARGDLNGDGANDFDDFRLFKQYYNLHAVLFGGAAPGGDAFAEMVASLNAPEPGAGLLAWFGVAVLAGRRARG